MDRQAIQEQMRDWAAGRRTPTGLPIPYAALPDTRFGRMQTPDYGTQVVLIEFTIPINWFGLYWGVVFGFASGGPAPLPGDITYVVDVDRPLGATDLGYTQKDYGNVTIGQLGSFPFGSPWPVEFKFETGQVVRIKATPNANVATGAGSFLLASLLGYVWPSEGWE